MILRFLFVLCLWGTAWNAHAQKYSPVKWHFSTIAVTPSEAQLVFTASLDESWHLYSQFIDEGGPLPTTFTFAPSPDYTPIGKVEEMGTPIKSYDKTFMMNIVWFAKTAMFTQKLKLHTPATTITGKIEFMACTGEMCLPPDVIDFSFNVSVENPEKKGH